MSLRHSLARLRRSLSDLRGHASVRPETASAGEAYAVRPPWECSEADTRRWNEEWIEYLRREWQWQLAPHTAYGATPPLPAQARAMLDLRLGSGDPWSLYCDADALLGRRVVELGCGCGNLGKLLGRYVGSYLGTDYSTLALAVARLVSPPNCTYAHVADGPGLAPFLGTLETAVGRYFWIHQNAALARLNLELLERFLAPGGRLYADFYWPDPDQEQWIVLRPEDALSRAYPSATFRYSLADVERLIAGRPWQLQREEVVPAMQRRYVVLERLG